MHQFSPSHDLDALGLSNQASDAANVLHPRASSPLSPPLLTLELLLLLSLLLSLLLLLHSQLLVVCGGSTRGPARCTPLRIQFLKSFLLLRYVCLLLLWRRLLWRPLWPAPW